METKINFKTKQQIAEDLNISYITLYRRLKSMDIKVPNNRMLSPAEYEPIYQYFLNGGSEEN